MHNVRLMGIQALHKPSRKNCSRVLQGRPDWQGLPVMGKGCKLSRGAAVVAALDPGDVDLDPGEELE